MNESFGAGFTQTDKTADTKSEGIVPLVIRQILNASEDGVKLFGMSYNLIKTVALIRSIDHASTQITYRLEDFSGQIDGKFWLEEDSAHSPQIMLNTYARVIGAVRNMAGVKTLIIYKIDSISSINELNTHLLEVVQSRYVAEEYSKKGVGGSRNNVPYAFQATNADVDMDSTNMGLKGKNALIYNVIKSTNAEIGYERTELKKKFTSMSEHELQNILEFLIQEGHIYTSIDVNHFLAV